jgi:hypothetical protein
MPLALQVSTCEYRLALAFAPSTVSLNNHPRRPTQNGRIAFSHGLCRLPDYAASCMRVMEGMDFRERCVGINV